MADCEAFGLGQDSEPPPAPPLVDTAYVERILGDIGKYIIQPGVQAAQAILKPGAAPYIYQPGAAPTVKASVGTTVFGIPSTYLWIGGGLLLFLLVTKK